MSKNKTFEFSLIHFVYITIIAILASAIVFRLMNMGAQNVPDNMIVYFDGQAITKQFMSELANEDFDSAEEARTISEIRSQDFAARLVNVVEEYENAGYFVMEKSQLMGGPLNKDVTIDIARKMKIDINYKPSGVREKWISKFKEKRFGL